MSYTLTPIDVTLEGLSKDIVVSSVTVTHRLNDLSACSLSLGYKTKAGLKSLQALFPKQGGAGVYQKEITVKVGDPGRKSTLKKKMTLFNGFVVGFGHRRASGNIEYVLNCKGGLYQLSQILLSAPGYTSASNTDLGVWSYAMPTAGRGGENNPEALLRGLTGKSAYDMYLEIVRRLKDSYTKTSDDAAFRAAKEAFGFASQESVLDKELSKVIVTDNIDSAFFSDPVTENSIGRNVVNMAVGSGNITFWQLLLQILEVYGLELITISDKVIIKVRNPLDLPPETLNFIKATDEIQVMNSDEPFVSPTRAIVTMNSLMPTHQRDEAQNGSYGMWPPTSTPTQQEIATGVKIISFRSMGFLNHVIAGALVELGENDKDKMKEADGNAVGHDDAKKKVEKNRKDIDEKIPDRQRLLNQYAKYILMKEVFKQRAGSLATRFMPEVVAGLPAFVEDPTETASFMCQIQEVTHSLDYGAAQAATSANFNYVRYGGELDPNPFKNPLYPDASSAKTEAVIKSILGL